MQRFQSIHWGRVANARPELAPTVQVVTQRSRGEAWWMLHDTVSGASFRLNAPAWQLVGRLDGSRSVDEVWQAVVALDIEAAPSQDETIQLLGTLGERGLLAMDIADELPGRRNGAGGPARKRRRPGFNPLAVRVPLGDPTRLIVALMPVFGRLVGRGGLRLWAVAMLMAAALFATHAEVLLQAARSRSASPAFLFTLWLVWPLMKAAHELAHGLVLMRFGGRTEEWGLTWWIVAASPYVDASRAVVLPSRRQRIAISAAGVMAELLLAALALVVWCTVEPGLVRDVALAVIVIRTVATLVVNANPLMRSDGYVLMIDALDLPNLDTRAQRFVREWMARRVLGVTTNSPLATSRREAAWYLAFIAAALPYRLAVTLTIVGWIASISGVLAAGGCVWVGWRWIVGPAARALRFIASADLLPRQRRRGLAAGVLAALVVAGGALLPAPRTVVVDGLVWVPEGTLVRAPVEGVVAEVFVRDRQPVHQGDALLRLDSPQLASELDVTRARVRAAEIEWSRAQATRVAMSSAAEEQLSVLRAREDWLVEQLEALVVKAPADGVIALHIGDHLLGRFITRGTPMAHVIGSQPSLVRAVLEAADAPAVLAQARGAEVRLAQEVSLLLPAAAIAHQPAGVNELPGRLLGDHGGGTIATDPADPEGVRTLREVFLADIGLDRPLERIGGRARVRFDLGREALGRQAWRRLRQLVLSHVDA